MSPAPAASTTSWRSAPGPGASSGGSRSTRRTGSTRWIPGPGSTLDPRRLAAFPDGYRHLAYLQSQLGYRIAPRLPGLRGPEVERLYQEGRDWRGGSAAPGTPAAEGLLSPGPG